MNRKTWDSVEGDYLAETILAVRVDFGERQLWVPKSLIANVDAFTEGDEEIQIESWWLEENNLL